MSSRSFGSLLVYLPLVLAAQSLRDPAVVPLNNWPAPRHLQRSQVETQQRVVTPMFQLPGGVTNDVLVFVPISPCRLADTRPSQPYPALGSTPLVPLTPRTLSVTGACGVPVPANGSGPEAYSFNVTVVPPGGTIGGYLLVYPNPVTPIPLVGSLTWNPAASYQTNAVISAASSDGSVNVVANATTDVVVDINGYYAAPSDGSWDTALGLEALGGGPPGADNTAVGVSALFSDGAGVGNVALGYYAGNNRSGSYNTLIGSGAGSATTTGYISSYNTMVGGFAGNSLVQGNYNVVLGYSAAGNLLTGSYNIEVGNEGYVTDDHTIRIGDVQTSTYIAGILGNNMPFGSTVAINSNGQLGVLPMAVSSRRYKDDIHDMGDASKGLLKLRPVTFHYKKAEPDGSKPLEYGLIAEEVAEVYPELVIRGVDGQIESVQYAKLPAMLLNELQKQYRRAEQQARDAEEQVRRIQRQDETIKKLEARLAALEAQSSSATAKAPSDKAVPSPIGAQ